jgi:superfamily II DNA or RNA helicase
MSNYEKLYPLPGDDNFLSKVYSKREYHLYRIPKKKKITNYEELQQFRDEICNRTNEDYKLQSQQIFLRNFISPYTPYKGVLLFHNVGVGKTCAAIQIAEQFREQVIKYNTKMIILVRGPAIENNWRHEILGPCTGEEYLSQYVDVNDLPEKEIKNANNKINKYYEIMSYKKLLQRVLGEKVKSDIKKYIRDVKGKIIREIAVNRINNLNNTVIIVDEAHNLVNNDYGRALYKLIRSSKSTNLKIVLLTATPMRNLASDIVFLINLLKPNDDLLELDKIFEKNKKETYKLKIKKGGIDYFKKSVKGYVSYLRGVDPMTFGKRVNMGEIPPKLQFTKLVRCYMKPFQLDAYLRVKRIYKDDSLSRIFQSVANIVFPDIKSSGKLSYRYGNKKIDNLKYKLKSNQRELILSLSKKIKGLKVDKDFMRLTNNNNISGSILNKTNLKHFSIKYYEALQNIENNIQGKNGPGTSFIFVHYIGIGINVFEEILKYNGYMDYFDKGSTENVKCYLCGKYEKNHPTDHEYSPATFISLTGEKSETDDKFGKSKLTNDKFNIIKKVFNKPDNSNGKYIKLLLGSNVLVEGISMYNIKDIHILDVHFTLTEIDQIVGRGIRYCSHYNLMNENNLYPEVSVYKYVISMKGELTSDEDIYRKAEFKYQTIKKIERAMKETAIDCSLNYHGNIYDEEVKKYKGCGKNGKIACPEECDFQECHYKCDDPDLEKIYDKKDMGYNQIKLDKIDYTTFNPNLMRSEIDLCKKKIKELYRKNITYTLPQIVEYIKNSYPLHQKYLFDDYFAYKAISELTPVTENDFNNFNNILLDKYNNHCYLIQRGRHYILQRFNENESQPMHHRRIPYDIEPRDLTIKNYLKKKRPDLITKLRKENKLYQYDKVYYGGKEEFEIVGIIAADTTKRQVGSKVKDVFNIRFKKKTETEKLREKYLQTEHGANCLSKSKTELIEMSKKYLSLSISKTLSKSAVCEKIKSKLLDLEQTTKGRNKKTYMIIPMNHSNYEFPYNKEDRIDYYYNQFNRYFEGMPKIKISIVGKKIIVKSNNFTTDEHEYLKEYNEKYSDNQYTFNMDK